MLARLSESLLACVQELIYEPCISLTRMEVQDEICARGFAVLRRPADSEFDSVLASLGSVIHEEAICSNGAGDALLSSTDALTPHTDHHAAHYIVWRCLEPAETGGDSVLVDGLALLKAMCPEHQSSLERVVLAEHSIFCGDNEEHPMVSIDSAGRTQIYYSYWLGTDRLAGKERAAFEAFARALHVVPQKRIKLTSGDVLVVDNHRMLHGRTSIKGTRTRLLNRYWLAPEPKKKRVSGIYCGVPSDGPCDDTITIRN